MLGYNEYSVLSDSIDSFGELFAGLIVIVGIIMLISLIISILYIIGIWKVLKKANQPGWGAIIPVYNLYLLCKISGVSPWWVLVITLSPMLNIFPLIGTLAFFGVVIYFLILLNVSIARSFGKEDAFAVGLILLPPFFYFALGVEDSEYRGENPMEDVLFNAINKKNTEPKTTNNQTNNTQYSYCSGCGNRIDKNIKFCPNCGKEIK